MRSTVAVPFIALAFVLAGCSFADSNPFPYGGQPGAHEFNPIAVGKSVQAVVAYLEPRPGDVLELVGAEPIGSFDGATVKLWLSRPVVTNGMHYIGGNLEEIPGAQIAALSASPGPDNEVGIVGEMVASRPGVFTVTDVRLRYRTNGGDVQTREGIAEVWMVCADTPVPQDCGPTPAG